MTKVMVVDDAEDTVLLTKTILKMVGFEVEGYSEPKKALEALKAGAKPDLLILDMRMPDMSGPMMCEEIRNDENLKDLKIVYFTASSEKDDPEMKKHKVSGTIFKPFDNKELVEQVRKFCR